MFTHKKNDRKHTQCKSRLLNVWLRSICKNDEWCVADSMLDQCQLPVYHRDDHLIMHTKLLKDNNFSGRNECVQSSMWSIVVCIYKRLTRPKFFSLMLVVTVVAVDDDDDGNRKVLKWTAVCENYRLPIMLLLPSRDLY